MSWVFTLLYKSMGACTRTHTHACFLSGYVFALIHLSIRTKNTTYARIHTHAVSDVTHTRHTIAVHPSSEKRKVDSLHHEK